MLRSLPSGHSPDAAPLPPPSATLLYKQQPLMSYAETPNRNLSPNATGLVSQNLDLTLTLTPTLTITVTVTVTTTVTVTVTITVTLTLTVTVTVSLTLTQVLYRNPWLGAWMGEWGLWSSAWTKQAQP